jgi:hypothetical protein
MGKLVEKKQLETCPCGQWMLLTPKKAERKFHGRPSGLEYNIVAVNKSWFKSGTEPWNKGKELPQHLKDRLSEISLGRHYSLATEFKPGQTAGVFNARWTGEDVSYGAVHSWVHRTYGKATRCDRDSNHISSRFHWHNKDLNYSRDINTWEQLCPSCHLKLHYQWKKVGICQDAA